MSDENPTPAEIAVAEAKAKALTAAKVEADATNAARSGKGMRVLVGSTRGRNTQVIQYEAFDEKQPTTLPTSLSEFMDLSKVQDEPTIVRYLVEGYNADSLANASDPSAEFVDKSWPEDVQKQFKIVVKNYANATGVSIEDAVALIKPGIVASQKK